jgi:hypothetical protein
MVTEVTATYSNNHRNQRPHLNTLPRVLVLMSWIHKRRMRNSPLATIIQRIIALDEQRLIMPLRIFKVPSMVRIRLDRVRLALAVGIDQRSGTRSLSGTELASARVSGSLRMVLMGCHTCSSEGE